MIPEWLENATGLDKTYDEAREEWEDASEDDLAESQAFSDAQAELESYLLAHSAELIRLAKLGATAPRWVKFGECKPAPGKRVVVKSVAAGGVLFADLDREHDPAWFCHDLACWSVDDSDEWLDEPASETT